MNVKTPFISPVLHIRIYSSSVDAIYSRAYSVAKLGAATLKLRLAGTMNTAVIKQMLQFSTFGRKSYYIN